MVSSPENDSRKVVSDECSGVEVSTSDKEGEGNSVTFHYHWRAIETKPCALFENSESGSCECSSPTERSGMTCVRVQRVCSARFATVYFVSCVGRVWRLYCRSIFQYWVHVSVHEGTILRRRNFPESCGTALVRCMGSGVVKLARRGRSKDGRKQRTQGCARNVIPKRDSRIFVHELCESLFGPVACMAAAMGSKTEKTRRGRKKRRFGSVALMLLKSILIFGSLLPRCMGQTILPTAAPIGAPGPGAGVGPGPGSAGSSTSTVPPPTGTVQSLSERPSPVPPQAQQTGQPQSATVAVPSGTATTVPPDPVAAQMPSPTASPISSSTQKPTRAPSKSPTESPTTSNQPSPAPSRTFTPTGTPTRSTMPTQSPTGGPSAAPSTQSPSASPSGNPSAAPTARPSSAPSARPTAEEGTILMQNYRQSFLGYGLTFMTEEQITLFNISFANYTFRFGPPVDPTGDRVIANCSFRINEQIPSPEVDGADSGLSILYRMVWSSRVVNVSKPSYSRSFVRWMGLDENKEIVMQDFISWGMNVTMVKDPEPRTLITPAPTYVPSSAPSFSPTNSPVGPPTGTVTVNQTIIIAASAGSAFVVILAAALFLRRRRQKNNNTIFAATVESHDKSDDEPVDDVMHSDSESRHSYGSASNESSLIQRDDSLIRQQESLVSQPSVVSGPNLSGETDSDLEDLESRNQMADEFDRYKNQNLEKMRAEVEGNVTDVDGMMSQALTRALIDDEDTNRDLNGLKWGGDGDSMEIEASVLCETNDWLKRKEGAGLEERRAFMQELLNKMVASVRFNIIGPEKASQAIHGAAAMLDLQLAGDLPETALVITGMRKKVERRDVIEAFREFGEIDGAAVSPNSRGFGLVRFKSPKSVQKAMERFKTDEIVVQDVSVNVRVLSAPSKHAAALVGGRASVQPVYPNEIQQAQYPVGGRERPGGVLQGGYEGHQQQLNIIAYPGDSLGNRIDDTGRRYPYSAGPRQGESEGGSNGGSVRSSNMSHHSRVHSSASNATNDTYGNARLRP